MDRLVPSSSVIVVVDVQERLASAMEPSVLERVVANASILLDAAKVLGVPVLATEQYPKGLGPTMARVRDKLAALGVTPIAKLDFDACGEPAFVRALAAIAPRDAIVIGMESHVCVFQTARELVRRGVRVHVVADAVASRTAENRAAGLHLAERAGAVLTVTETVVFDLVGRAGTDAFKAISKLVK